MSSIEFDLPLMLIQVLTGLSRGMILFIIASGFTLVFGISGVLNIYHGTFVMLGAYAAFSVCSWLVGVLGSFWLALFLAPVAVGLVAAVIERFILRPLYRRELHYYILAMFGLILISGDLVKIVWGTQVKCIPTPEIFGPAIQILGWSFPTYYLFIIAVGPIVGFGLWFLFYRTRLGSIVRATAFDPDMMNALGTNVPLVLATVFGTGAALAGFAGGLTAGMSRIEPSMDLPFLILAMIIVVIGGVGSFRGALLGALLIGQLEAFGVLFAPQLAMIIPYALMAVILIVRPWGLFGREIRPL